MTVLNLQVGQGSDDGFEWGPGSFLGNTTHDGSGVLMGDFGTPGSTFAAFRWAGVSGLSGSAISAATLNFPSARDTDSGSFIGDWYAEDAAAPPTITEGTANFNITPRTKTTATCEGDGSDFGDWTAGDNGGSGWDFVGDGINTIADIIQELADSYDPSTIVLLLAYTSGSGERVPHSYDFNSAYGAKLSITYTSGGGSTQTAPTTDLASRFQPDVERPT